MTLKDGNILCFIISPDLTVLKQRKIHPYYHTHHGVVWHDVE